MAGGAPLAPAAFTREAIARALSGALPGAPAQAAMAPAFRGELARAALGRPRRMAAVLVLLYPAPGGPRFPLILRPEGPAVHDGQVSLPGGSLEAGESAAEAALRETEEELGVSRSFVAVIGALSDLDIPASGFLVSPFVGWTDSRPDYAPSCDEVACVVEASLSELLDPASARVETWSLEGRDRSVPCYRLGGRTVWGATAMMLAELRAALLARPGRSLT